MQLDKKEITQRKKEETETARIETFSDGVFSIAITLLVLDLIAISRPKDAESLAQSFLDSWQSFFAFTLGFTTLLVCWINHHHLFSYIQRFDTNLMWLNGLLLIVVTFTPFSTVVFADYLTTESNAAVAIFGATYFMMSAVYNFVWSYAFHHQLVDDSGNKDYYKCIMFTYRYSIAYTFIAFFICFISIPAAIVMYVVMFAVFAYPKEFALRLYALKLKKSGVRE